MQRRLAAVLSALLAAAALGLAPAPQSAQAALRWAPAAKATIHPGVQVVTDGAQCTSNFVFLRGTQVLLGMAAHCASTGGPTETNGCTTGSLKLGTKVSIQGATRPGVLVYSSWLTMQKARERDAAACQHNDFALVRIDPVDVKRVNPSVPHWGGPRGMNRTGLPNGSDLYTYGSSSLRFGLKVLSPKSGTSLGSDNRGWSHPAYTVSPGIPGDSGSALLDAQGRAAGVLSTVAVAPFPASNRFTDLLRATYYAAIKGYGVTLVNGTQTFRPDKLPLGI
jgi:hypothetical protein